MMEAEWVEVFLMFSQAFSFITSMKALAYQGVQLCSTAVSVCYTILPEMVTRYLIFSLIFSLILLDFQLLMLEWVWYLF